MKKENITVGQYWMFLLLLVLLLLPTGRLWAYPFPDTGQTKCYLAGFTPGEITCPSPGQAFYGQDAQYNLHPRSYTKLDSSGNALPDSATSWTMVRDNVTGLIWEKKTTDNSIHNNNRRFTWCDTNPATNGGNQGICGTGTGNAATDTQAFINALNSAHYGGYSDWRMPTVKELSTLVNLSIQEPGPTIDAAWFSNTVPFYYWSSTSTTVPNINFGKSAWYVNFARGEITASDKNTTSNEYSVLAVRGNHSSSNLVDNGDGTVTDTTTGLMWQKVTAPDRYTWEQALAYCQNLNLAGYSDWRLPDRNELQSLVDYSRYKPIIDPLLAADTVLSNYRSSTTVSNEHVDGAWGVNFYHGYIGYDSKSNDWYVRAVRAGQSWSFTDQTYITLSTMVISNILTITGITAASPISIICGEYSVSTDGGATWSAYSTSVPSTVNLNDQVRVRQTSSSDYFTRTDATLTIGELSDTFSVTTINDTTPDSFTFIDQTGVALNTVVTSNIITVTGITGPSPISITRGQYSISTDGGLTWSAYSSSTPSTVSLNNLVKVRQTSSSSYSKTTNAILTIGGVSDTFSVTTLKNPALLITITTDPNPDSLNAPWTLTGPDASMPTSGNGDVVDGNLDAGTYTITWGDVSGWEKPTSQTQTIISGSSFTFTGTYHFIISNPPTSASMGNNITINGSNFGANQGGGYVDFNGVRGTVVSWSDTQIVVTVPYGSTTGCMTVVTDNGTSSCVTFTVGNPACYPPVKLSNYDYFNVVQDAYDNVNDGNAVLLQTGTFVENVLLDRNITTILQGGYNCPYYSNPGYSTIKGSLTITKGTVTVDKLVIAATASTTPTYSISGSVSGAVTASVTITLTGAGSTSTITDSAGNYSFSGAVNGNYTITLSKTGYSFSPSSINITVNNANVTAQNFTATANTYSISGTVSGAVVSGVTIILTGSGSSSVTTDGNGNYSFSNVANGSYTVTPNMTGYMFSPLSISITVNNVNIIGRDFTAKKIPWTQKADFGGIGRGAAVGFSIGTKGYIGTGINDSRLEDFWEYNSTTNTWTQKADFGGGLIGDAVGFSIGSKGYIGTGDDGFTGSRKAFWEYDPTSNAWTRKADLNGTGRLRAVGFSIGTKGYIGTGDANNINIGTLKDFWEYDPTSNAWTQKADFGGTARENAVGFSIGSKGYIGTGFSDGYYTTKYKDFWEYDPTSNAWTQKADFGGTARGAAVGFSIGSKGYVGTGLGSTFMKDFWEYDPTSNAWTQKADFRGGTRWFAVGFSIGSKGYIGTGSGKDFWEYDPSLDE